MALSGGERGAPAHAGEFQLLDRRVVDSIVAVDDQHPFIRGAGGPDGRPVGHGRVPMGTKASRPLQEQHLVNDRSAVNAYVTTARAPSRVALMLGVAASTFGILFGLVALVALAVTRGEVEAGIPTLIVGVFLFGGLNLFFIGLIGEYVLGIHSQVRRGPAMFEIERINFDD